MDMTTALAISAAGMSAQTTRLRVIAENLANQDTTGSDPNTPPYRRKTVTFRDSFDPKLGVPLVEVAEIGSDPSAFPKRYDPSHPAADAEGYVRLPNVNPFIEMMDMRDAERTYSANLAVMQAAREMLTRTIALLQ